MVNAVTEIWKERLREKRGSRKAFKEEEEQVSGREGRAGSHFRQWVNVQKVHTHGYDSTLTGK